MTSQDFPKDFAGTEHYRERVEERTVVADGGYALTSVAYHRISPADYREDVLALCDHIDWQQCHIEALDVALRESGERRAGVEKQVEDLQEKNKQAWERAALEARRVLKNGSKARKLEQEVEERDKGIEGLRAALGFYADEENWRHYHDSGVFKGGPFKGERWTSSEQPAHDNGKCAREALEKELSTRTESSEEKP